MALIDGCERYRLDFNSYPCWVVLKEGYAASAEEQMLFSSRTSSLEANRL